MDKTLAWVIIAAFAVVVIWALTMGRRFIGGSFRFGKHMSATLDAKQGALVKDSTAYGVGNRTTASGDGAEVNNTRSVGKGNVIGASTVSDAPVRSDPVKGKKL